MATINKTLPQMNALLFRDGVYYGELELNQVAFPFTGRIEAQTPLCAKANNADFVGEVGMILVVDKWVKDAEGNELPAEVRPMTTADTAATASLFCLNYSTETVYDERERGLRYFHQVRGTGSYDWLGNGDQYDIYPRLGYLSVGDRFTTSAIDVAYGYDDTKTKEVNITNFKASLSAANTYSNGKYLKAGLNGYWVACDDITTAVGPVVRIVDNKIGMPDGSFGFKVEVVKA